jgi:hypothetical protein
MIDEQAVANYYIYRFYLEMIRFLLNIGFGFGYLKHLKGHINHPPDILSRLVPPESSLQELSANTTHALYA